MHKLVKFVISKRGTIQKSANYLVRSKKIFKNLSIFLQVGLGFSYIDTETERLAKGFTFIENENLGLYFQINSKTSIHFFGGLGHVSNFNFQLPNSGYNIFSTGFGIQYSIK